MRPLTTPPGAPGPSRFAYRLSRAWAQAWVRSLVTVYLPLSLAALGGWAVVSTDRLRLAIEAEATAFVDRIAARPEFRVRGVAVDGAGPDLDAVLRALVGPVRGQSSLRLDLDGLRQEIESLGEVASAGVFFDAAGTLRIVVVERVPVALWREPTGSLWVIDQEGVLIARAGRRSRHPQLPLLAGLGAPQHIDEVFRLIATAPALRSRVRAFARIGGRRWDLVLDRGLTIKLPETAPERTLAGTMALQFGQELLERDLAVIDLRVPQRPTLRLSPRAAEQGGIDPAVDLRIGEDT
ncbi:MAG: cell division protein FtsQ/DivIB [Pikeienuella sp.]